MHTMEDAIKKTNHQVAEIRRQQRIHFEAYLAVNETVSERELPTISEKPEDALIVGSQLGKGSKGEELWPYREEAHELSHNRTKTSHDADQTCQMDEEKAGRKCEEGDTVKIAHKRVEALQSLASGPSKLDASEVAFPTTGLVSG